MLTMIQTKIMAIIMPMITGSNPSLKGKPLSYLGMFLPYNDFFENVRSLIESLNGKITPLVAVVAALCLVVLGIMWIVTEDSRRNAKRWLPNVLIGIIIALSASTIVDTVKSVSGF